MTKPTESQLFEKFNEFNLSQGVTSIPYSLALLCEWYAEQAVKAERERCLKALNDSKPGMFLTPQERAAWGTFAATLKNKIEGPQ